MNTIRTTGIARSSSIVIAGVAVSTAFAGAELFGETLVTKYDENRTFEVSVSQEIKSETTAMSLTVDGEERGGDRMRGGPTESSYTWSYTDQVMAATEGAPTKVQRSFGDIGGETSRSMRGEERTVDMESAFDGITVVFSNENGEVEVEVTEGEAPDGERLEGHALTLPLDGLLPDGEVEIGDTWEISGEAFVAALGLETRGKLIDRPERPERGGGEGRGRGGRGRGGMFGGGNRQAGMIAGGDWTVQATLTEETAEESGLDCMVIEIEAEVEGTPPAREGRGGRDFSMRAAVSPEVQESEYEGEFKGQLLWSKDEQRPVALTVEGEYTLESSMSRETQRGAMEMESTVVTEMNIEMNIGAGTAK